MDALLTGVLVAVAMWLALIAILILSGRGRLARELAHLLPNVIRLFHGLLRDGRVPLGSKVVVAIGLAWLVSPIDLIPEFIPIAGPLDDAIVAALVLRYVLRSAPRVVVAEHWRGDPATLDLLLRL